MPFQLRNSSLAKFEVTSIRNSYIDIMTSRQSTLLVFEAMPRMRSNVVARSFSTFAAQQAPPKNIAKGTKGTGKKEPFRFSSMECPLMRCPSDRGERWSNEERLCKEESDRRRCTFSIALDCFLEILREEGEKLTCRQMIQDATAGPSGNVLSEVTMPVIDLSHLPVFHPVSFRPSRSRKAFRMKLIGFQSFPRRPSPNRS